MFPKTVSLKGILKFSKRNFVSLLLKRFPYENSENRFSYIRGKESIKISNEELEILEKEIKEYKNVKKIFDDFSKEINEAV